MTSLLDADENTSENLKLVKQKEYRYNKLLEKNNLKGYIDVEGYNEGIKKPYMFGSAGSSLCDRHSIDSVKSRTRRRCS